jgi:hypothetical protein
MFIRGIVAISTAGAAAVVLSASALAQSNNPASSQLAQPSSTQAAAQSTDTTTPMKVVGCLMKESDYRKAHKLGQGALGGIGLGDEFVLVNATIEPMTSSSASSGSSDSPSSAPASSKRASTSRCTETGQGTAYRMTGQLEEHLKSFVGHRMEITGTFDHARDVRTAEGQTDAKLPPEIKIASYRDAPLVSPPAAASTPLPASTVAQNEPPAAPAVGTTGELPKTASNEPLIALIGVMFLAAGVGIDRLRRRYLM